MQPVRDELQADPVRGKSLELLDQTLLLIGRLQCLGETPIVSLCGMRIAQGKCLGGVTFCLAGSGESAGVVPHAIATGFQAVAQECDLHRYLYLFFQYGMRAMI